MINFLKVGPSEYVNLDQIARVEFKTENGRFQAVVFFAKPGGSDRHFIDGDGARSLEQALENMTKPARKATAARK